MRYVDFDFESRTVLEGKLSRRQMTPEEVAEQQEKRDLQRERDWERRVDWLKLVILILTSFNLALLIPWLSKLIYG